MKMKSFWRCRKCEKKLATWIYMPDDGQEDIQLCCDECVPKGCSCNAPDEQYLPCCEWWPITQEDIKENPEGFPEE